MEGFRSGCRRTETEKSRGMKNSLQQCFLAAKCVPCFFYNCYDFPETVLRGECPVNQLCVMSQRVSDTTLHQVLARPFETTLFLLLSKHVKGARKHQFSNRL